MKRPPRPTVDVLIPVYNEEEVLPLLFERLGEVFSQSNRSKHGIESVRYLLVDDGSTDNSAKWIVEAIAAGAPAVLYRLSRNFGHQNAVSAALDHSTADVAVIIDADLQDPPELIPEFIARWRDGYEVVYGRRRRRKENFLKVAAYFLFYRLLNFLADMNIPLDSGDFCLLDRRVVQAIQRLPERLRFPRGLRAWVGFRNTGLAYDRPPRQAGRSKYAISKLYHLATDGVAAMSIRPLQIAQTFGLVFLFVATVLVVLLLLELAEGSTDRTKQFFLLTLLLVSIASCVQAFCMYILGSYVGRAYLETKGRPSYVLMEVVGAKGSGRPEETDAPPHAD